MNKIDSVKLALEAFLIRQGASPEYISQQINTLLNTDGFRSRFEWFSSYLDETHKDTLLISGAACGAELQLAKEYGFRNIYGTEVVGEYIDICALQGFKDGVKLYDGTNLPFQDNYFSMVISGHIIEHTASPMTYINEHFRCLKKGGVLFIEWPSRYHWKELHTGLPSVEWFPEVLRKIVIRILISSLSFLNDKAKSGYRDILSTLKPVSVWQIKYWLKKGGYRFDVLSFSVPASGINRILLKKL